MKTGSGDDITSVGSQCAVSGAQARRRLIHVFRCVAAEVQPAAAQGAQQQGEIDSKQARWADANALDFIPDPQFDSHKHSPRLHDKANDPLGRAELLGSRQDELLRQYRDRGYIVCRSFLNCDQVERLRRTVSRIIGDWLDQTAPEIKGAPGPPFVDLDPRVVAGEVVPTSRELAVRRLFRLATHDDTMRRHIVGDQDLLAFTTKLLGPDIKLIQSMALLKPPGTGEKRFHQDTAVMRLTPNTVCGWWVALDPTTVDNGCMQLWARSQHHGLVPHHLPVPASPAAHIYYSVKDPPPPGEVVAIPMQPGDAMVFDVSCVHGSGPNTANSRRWAIQMQYAPSYARVVHCPEPRSTDAQRLGITQVTKEVGEVFEHVHRSKTTPYSMRSVAWAPNVGAPAPFDCECVEPQYWSYRKAEMHVCGRDDFGPDCI